MEPEIGGSGAAPTAQTMEQRIETAHMAVDALGLTMQTLADDMNDSVNRTYGAWPDRAYVIGTDGLVAFQGEPGPRGFSVEALEAALLQVSAAPPEQASPEAPAGDAPEPDAPGSEAPEAPSDGEATAGGEG
jgi:hypothetical protein